MKKFFFCLLIPLFLIGCGSTDVYKDVFKDNAPSYNYKTFAVSSKALYPAVEEAVCSKNFIIDQENESQGVFLAKRYFQRGKRRMILTLQAKIIPSGADTASLFLNAIQTTERDYVADRTRFFLWVVPLPGGGGKQATQIKEGEKIVRDPQFYADFFAMIQKNLKQRKTSKHVVAAGNKTASAAGTKTKVSAVKKTAGKKAEVPAALGAASKKAKAPAHKSEAVKKETKAAQDSAAGDTTGGVVKDKGNPGEQVNQGTHVTQTK